MLWANDVPSPVPLEIERKFEVTGPVDLAHPVLAGAVKLEIKQTYLIRTDLAWKERVRRVRHADGQEQFFHTAKRRLYGIVQEEDEREITRAEYEDLRRFADPKRKSIRKRRLKFMHDGRIWELDLFKNPPGFALLEVELDNEHEQPTPPPFLNTVDRTGDGRFSSRQIAKQLAKQQS